jgi:anti-sigma-K factor RskA
MSLSNPMVDPHACAGDAAAYALGALEPHEARIFAAHVETCVICRDELTAFQEVTRALPMAAPQHPLPRGLRRRVVADFRRSSTVAAAAHPAPAARARWRAFPRPAMALGAAAMLAVATAGGLALGTSGAPSTRVLRAQVLGSPGSAQLRVAGDRGELIVHHLPSPAAGHVYEVWLKRSGHAPAPTNALFGVTSGGDGDVEVPGSLSHVNQVVVTQEPAGGSAVPTSGQVIVARLT